jgi:hypothetical protein
MGADFDAKLTGLTAEILRDAVAVYDAGDSERLLLGFNPVLTQWNTGMFSTLESTGSFSAITSSVPALSLTGAPQAAAGSHGPTGTLKNITGSFKAITGSFRALAEEPTEPPVTLRRVFRLPSKLPGVRLPADAELGAMARSAPIMRRLDALARWLGRDRTVTETDELTDVDAADASRRLGIRPGPLACLWEYALTSGWFELADSADRRRTWAEIGPAAWRWTDGDDRGALHVWAAVFAAVAATTLDVLADSDPDIARRLNFEGQGVALAVMLFMSRRSGMTTRDVEELVRDGAIGKNPTARLKRSWEGWVRQHGDPAHHLLAELAELRAVLLPRTADGPVELTPLAQWALREQFVLDKIKVSVLPSPSPQMSPAALVALSDAVREAEFDAAFGIWMRGRDPERAVRELLLYAGSSTPHGRLTAVELARRIGLPGHRAWLDAMKRPELRGYARITLASMAGYLPRAALPQVLEPDPDEMSWLATDLLATACGVEDPDPDEIAAQFADAVPVGEEEWTFELMARSTHPDVGRVLSVISAYHPDRRVARSARKAARGAAKSHRPANGRRVPAGTAIR